MEQIGFKPKGIDKPITEEYTRQDLVWIAVCLDRSIVSHLAELNKPFLSATEKAEALENLEQLQTAYDKTQTKLGR
jgi:hypothetical protein